MRTFLTGPALGWGIRLALTFAIFHALASLIHTLIRRVSGEAIPLPLDQVSTLDLALAHILGGLVSGLSLRQLWPLARRRSEAVAVGSLAASQ
jgi:hypothetical protein